ncbi:ABC transporter permease [Roseivirga sp. UBA838]|uniref:ABC transporter permease n=1 Tax=Roseivirga sp. UBA838 TaxID=1947393 RepID=UPI00257F70B3|nr:ABC transporter permease [Roseivirga sp. UBA838]|tara:strand:- start:12210 stop:14870 length:2661 start_codon:yes stop_codon:yes gene_type:complete
MKQGSLDHQDLPNWANRFLEWYCADELIDEIQGDLLEAFYYRKQTYGLRKARWWFIWDVLKFFRPSSFRKRSFNSIPIAMFKNYIVVSLRNFRKQKGYSFINLSGLVAGIAACLLISLHVLKELSYDNFHPKAESTYRVVMDMYGNGQLKVKSAPVYPAVAPALLAEFPEVEMVTRILPFGGGVYSVKTASGTLVRYNEEHAVLADANFFEMFGFELIEGDRREALNEANRIVLSESAAARYFGDKDPIGQSIYWRGTRELMVTGVFKDFPENSHMKFELITSLKSWNGYEDWPNNWGWYDFYTFVKTADNVDQETLDARLETFLDGKKAEMYEKYNAREVLWTQNIRDIHLYSEGLGWDMGENGGADQIYFLSVIAALILIIAWVNYVNLATARAVKRAKEVGIRKVVGAYRSNLLLQFLVESFLYNLFAVLLAGLLVALAVPYINGALEFTLDRHLLLSTEVLSGLLVMVIAGSLCSGLYPAFVLTSFQPVKVLKGKIYKRNGSFGFRQVLVIFQFTASITLILGTFLVVKQLNYMRNQELGINIDQTLVIHSPSSGRDEEDLENRLKLFKEELNATPGIAGFTLSNSVPGIENFFISGYTSKHYPNQLRDIYRMYIDENFFDQFEIDLIAGRSFDKNLKTDTAAVLLNLNAMNHLGFNTPEEAIGEKVNPGNEQSWNIIGVVENYHQASLKEDLDPIIFFYNPNAGNYYSLKLSGSSLGSIMDDVEAKWDAIYPDNPFDYFFLDERFDRQYKSDEQFNAVFIGFAALAIFVACLGLFGLVSFTAEQSKKEIGIRKVLGASSNALVMLLAKDYAKLILVAIVLAFPLGYYWMSSWLNNFAYQTNIGAGIFIFGGSLMALIAFLTVSFKSFSAANNNPVNVLRDE